jgi:hypothetical protein
MATWGQSRVGTIDPSLNHDKNNYYHSFKTWIEIRLKVRPGSRVRLTIYPGQRKDKSGYYHNFQTWLKGQPWARLRSQVKLTIDPSQRDNKNDYYHSLKPNSVVDPGPGSGHMSCWLLIQVNIRIKIIIIIILKLNSIVDLRQNPGREPGPLTWVNLEVDLVRLTQIQKQI